MSDKKSHMSALKRGKNRPRVKKTLPELYRSVDLQGVIIDCNEAYAEKLGYSVDEVVGTNFEKHTAPENIPQLRRNFEEWKRTGTSRMFRTRVLTRDGEEIEMMLSVGSIVDKQGKVAATATILRDMNELISLQELVKIRKYESLYENSPDMYRTVNYAGIIIDCNRTYLEKLGYVKDEVLGVNLLEHTAEKSRGIMRVNMASWRNTGEGDTSEIWMRRKDGKEFPVILTPTNLYDDDGLLVGRNVVIKDATELYDTKRVLDEREKIDRMKEEFLSVITHELKSPLTPIIGFAQALTKPNLLGSLNEKQMGAVNTILSNSNRLRKLIGDLLDAHKLELGKMKFDVKEFGVNDLLEDIQRSFEFSAKEKNISILCSAKGQIAITSDRDRIEQVVTNLIYNAIDFVPQGSGRIQVVAEMAGAEVKFSVIDNGTGIPKEKQRQLFTKFYQADTTQTRKHGGTGLGLSICKGIIERLDGRIRVESVEGQGSNFYFILPQRFQHENSAH